MDKQREILKALLDEYTPRIQAEAEIIKLDLEGQETLLPANVYEALNHVSNIHARAGRAQSEAILGAVATVIARYISKN